MIFSIQPFLKTITATQNLWIAYSGGLDSHVLLHALAQSRSHLKLQAIHIHHGLHAQADYWAKHCQEICKVLEIPCEVRHVNVHIAPGDSLEANARVARYDAITQCLAQNDIVLTAQHADDQAETLLLQLLRGAGIAGLAAMPSESNLGKGKLVRPLLVYTRAELQEYAVKNDLHWIEDSSNADTRFDRNFLRHDIMPILQHRWSSINHILCRAARHQAEADELVQILAANDLQTCEGNSPEQLYLSSLLQLSQARQRNVLRFWIKNLSLPIPSTVQLKHIFSDVLTAKEDRQPLVRWQGGEVRRYRESLFAMPNLPTRQDALSWTLPQSLQLALGKLTVKKVEGEGLAVPAGTSLDIRFRQGGETLRWHGHLRVVKKLLQAAKMPPWQRQFLPLIYLNNTLVAIPNICVADGFVAQETGWKIEWQYKNG